MSDIASLKDKIRHVYDLSSSAYAAKYSGELDYKPRDRELLLDLGCGPGHATNFLRQLGAVATGVDLSPGMVEEARRQYPMCEFVAADFCHLPFQDSSIVGIVGLYAIVNLTHEIVASAFAEMHRVLKTGISDQTMLSSST